MSNKKIYYEIFHSTFVHSGLRAIFSLITAGCMLVIIRVMGPEEYGKFSLILQLAVTSGLFLSWGWSGTLGKFLPELTAPEDKRRLSSQAMEITTLSIFLYALGFYAIYFFRPGILPLEIKELAGSIVAFASLFGITNVLQGIYRGQGRFIEWSILDGLNNVTCRISVLGIMYLLGFKYQIAFYVFVITTLLFAIYSLIQLRGEIHLVEIKLEKNVVNFAMISLVGSFVYMGISSIDAVLLRTLLKDARAVGYYFAGIRIPQIFQSLVIAPLSIPFIYYFTHPRTYQTREKIIDLGTRTLGFVSAIVSLSLFSFGGPIVSLFYGHFYGESITVLRIYSFMFFLYGTTSLFAPYFVSINRFHVILINTIFTLIFMTIMDYFFIPIWRAAGPALSNVLSTALQNYIYIHILSKHGIPFAKANLLLAIGVTLSVFIELYLIPFSSVPVFITFCLIAKIFSKEEITSVKKIIMDKKERTALAEN